MKKQIKTRLSRVLCTALALCMIVALIPSAFAETVEGTNDFKIDFLNDVTGTNGQAYPWGTELGDANVWASHSLYLNGAAVTKTPTKNQLRYSGTYGMAIYSAQEGDYYALKFQAPATGKYRITYNHYQAHSSNIPNGGIGDVYLLSESEDLSANITNRTGTIFKDIEYGATENVQAKALETPEYDFEVGEKYIIAFVATGCSAEKESYRMYPTSLTFTYVEPTYSDVEAVYSFSTINKDSVNGYVADAVTTPDMITYENSSGRVEFDTIKTSADTGMYGWQREVSYFKLDYIGEYVAFRIRVPKAGTYYATLDYLITDNSATADMYIIKNTGEIESLLDAAEPVISKIDFWDGTKYSDGTKAGVFYADVAGEYYLIFKHISNENTIDRGYVRPAKLTLSGSKDLTTTKGYPVAGINIDELLFEEGESATFTITANDSENGTVLTADVENLKSSDDEIISISGNTVTAEGPGVVTITADVNGYPAAVILTVNDAVLSEAFTMVNSTENYIGVGRNKTIKVLKYSDDGVINEYATDVTVKYNQETTVEAENIGTPDGYRFLYWAKGATNSKQIIPGDTIVVYPTVEVTYLIAVYEPIDAPATDKVEFYNYNGQLLDCEITQDGKMPALPSMTGYGTAKYWALYGSAEAYEGGADAPAVSGNMVFVAQYDALEENITVTVNNGSGDGNYKFGDTVTCVAEGEGEFKWWTKTVNGKTEIVSLNSEYTFKAWETCTVEAVFGDKGATYVGDTMRIILDELTVVGTTNKAYMAEFVGLELAVEKGIMLGTKKIAMSSKDNQFTVINDTDETVIKGYAILANGTLITNK